MIYRAIGLMSGSSLDGLDIVFAELHENAGKWTYEIIEAGCRKYSASWIKRLKEATGLNAVEYLLLDVDYGHYLGKEINEFIQERNLQYKVALISSHGHTTFHIPSRQLTAQLGDGASIAAATLLPVVSNLRSMDMAFHGQGAPIVPIGEKLLLPGYDYYLNLGGIANISINASQYVALDICAANQVLNMFANKLGKEYDDKGMLAATGIVNQNLLEKLNGLAYYGLDFPKSLGNEFSVEKVMPLIKDFDISPRDGLRTYVEHIAVQIKNAIARLQAKNVFPLAGENGTGGLLATGGGAHNSFLIERIQERIKEWNIEIVIPDENLINYKEALIMALIGVLRWREKPTVLSSVTGASKDSVGGALWMGQAE